MLKKIHEREKQIWISLCSGDYFCSTDTALSTRRKERRLRPVMTCLRAQYSLSRVSTTADTSSNTKYDLGCLCGADRKRGLCVVCRDLVARAVFETGFSRCQALPLFNCRVWICNNVSIHLPEIMIILVFRIIIIVSTVQEMRLN